MDEASALELDFGSLGAAFNASLNASYPYNCQSDQFNASALGGGSWGDSLLCPPLNDSIQYKDPSYYAIPYRIIGTIFQGFILMVGEYSYCST